MPRLLGYARHGGVSQRRGEVEQVRDRFRRTGYDHPQTTFENENAISDTLKNVLKGVVRSGVLWDLLRQGYRSRPTQGRPDFGSPGFPFPFPLPDGSTGSSRGDDWREPSSHGSWSPGPSRKDMRTLQPAARSDLRPRCGNPLFHRLPITVHRRARACHRSWRQIADSVKDDG